MNVFITGSAKGIGREMAKAFWKDGANVAVGYKNSLEKAQKLAREIGGFAVFADLDTLDGAKNAAETLSGVFSGRLDVLVNNAGISLYKLLIDCSEREINDCIASNLVGSIYMTSAALPLMLKDGGSIINISSVWAGAGSAMESVYSAAKAGLVGFTKAIAKEYGSAGVRANCILPGLVAGTEMSKIFSETDILNIKESTPLGEICETSDIAETAVFLAKSKLITGETVTVDGGFTL